MKKVLKKQIAHYTKQFFSRSVRKFVRNYAETDAKKT